MEHGHGLLEVSGRVLAAAQPQIDNAEVGQHPGFPQTIADLAGQAQSLLVIACRLLVAALPLPGPAEAAERAGFAETVADVAVDGNSLLLMTGGLRVAAQLHLSNAHVTQH